MLNPGQCSNKFRFGLTVKFFARLAVPSRAVAVADSSITATDSELLAGRLRCGG